MTGPERSRPPARRPLSRTERAAARLITGPAGHLAAGVTDWAVLLARYGWARARGRRPGHEAP